MKPDKLIADIEDLTDIHCIRILQLHLVFRHSFTNKQTGMKFLYRFTLILYMGTCDIMNTFCF